MHIYTTAEYRKWWTAEYKLWKLERVKGHPFSASTRRQTMYNYALHYARLRGWTTL